MSAMKSVFIREIRVPFAMVRRSEASETEATQKARAPVRQSTPRPHTPYDEKVTKPFQNRPWRSLLAWFVAAAALWLIAGAVDRRTEVVIENLGDHVRFDVAGTEVMVPGAISSVNRLRLWVTDSIDSPRVHLWEVTHDGVTEELSVTPGTNRTMSGPAPVGDWWVDHRSEPKIVGDHGVALTGTFAIRLLLSGRFTNEASLTTADTPTLHFSFRRGFKDNYLVVRDATGAIVDVTTLAPTPFADAGALTAQVFRGISAACLVIAFIGFAARVGSKPQPSSQPTRAGRPRRTLAHRYAVPAMLILAVIGGSLSIWVATGVLGGLPHQIDEVVYLLQARWMLDGDVAPSATAIQDHLRVPFTYFSDGQWIGHYPAGWPALLALGMLLGAPHLVASILGMAMVLLVFLVGREIDDEITGLAAATLAVVSPLARVLSASLFPHVACAVLVMLALWLLLVARRRPNWWCGAGAGAAMGLCLAVRPMTAVAVSVVLGGWLVFEGLAATESRRNWMTLCSAIPAGLLAAIPTLMHNAATTGAALSLPYSLAAGPMYDASLAPFGLRNLDAILASASAGIYGWGWPILVGGLALALPLAFSAIPFVLRRTRPEDRLLLVLLLVVAIGHLPTRAHGLHGYGARYFMDIAPCFFLLTARGFRELARWARPSVVAVIAVVAIFATLNVTALAVLPHRLGLFRDYYDVTGDLERQIEATGLDEAIILVDDEDWQPWGEGARLMTGPRRLEIIIGADLEDNSVITKAYPERPVLRWDGEHLQLEDRGGD